MDYNFENDRPIYLQLVEKLRIEIVSGSLKKGERLPSVRELALITKVNPNTMQKALAELEEEKLIYTERTNGKFVTEDSKLIEKVKVNIAKEKVKEYIKSMKSLGIDYEEAAKYIAEAKKK